MDKIWDRKSFEVGCHWPLWREWKTRMTTQNRQKNRTLKRKYIFNKLRIKHTFEVHILFPNFRIVCIKTFGKSLQLFPNTYWKLLICWQNIKSVSQRMYVLLLYENQLAITDKMQKWRLMPLDIVFMSFTLIINTKGP